MTGDDKLIHRQHADLYQTSTAVFSDCEKYRYSLVRTWDASLKSITYLMLNPSTADEMVNDPTIARCQRRAFEYGYGQMIISNLFPYRMTLSSQLDTVENLLGDSDVADRSIIEAVEQSSITVCGWGSHHLSAARAKHVFKLLNERALSSKLHALQINQDGSPKHPLYVAYAKHPERFVI